MLDVRYLLALAMALTITHTTPADGSFSAGGAAAWDAAHTVTGTVDISSAWPVGAIFISAVATDPSTLLGFGTWSLIGQGQVLVGFKSGDASFGTLGATGGATGVAAVGTNSTAAFTPDGTIDMTLYIPKGTNSSVTATDLSTISWPASVPSFAGTTGTFTGAFAWPATAPAFAGVAVPGHKHELPIIHTANNVMRLLADVTGFGTGSARVPNMHITSTSLIADVSNSGAVMLSATCTGFTPAGTNTWPNNQVTGTTTVIPAGVISWPAGVPTSSNTAITIPAQTFTGAVGSGTASFSGTPGVVPAQTFTGSLTSVVQPYLVVNYWQRTA